MSRGKYLSLEEARKAGQLGQFAKEHPIDAVHPPGPPRGHRPLPSVEGREGEPVRPALSLEGGAVKGECVGMACVEHVSSASIFFLHFNDLRGTQRASVAGKTG